jgi:hypothetical protein
MIILVKEVTIIKMEGAKESTVSINSICRVAARLVLPALEEIFSSKPLGSSVVSVA